MEITIVSIGLLIFLSLFFSWIFDKVGIPDVLPLFAIGLILGPLTGIIDVDSFQTVGEIFAIVTLSVILFEAGLGIKLRSLFKSAGKATALMFLFLIATVLVVTPLAKILFDITYLMGLAVGTILAGTSATVIVPLIRKLNVEEDTKTFLKLESSLNNIVIIVLVFGVFNAIQVGDFNPTAIVSDLAIQLSISVAVGAVAAFFWSQILARMRGIQKSMFTTPAFLLVMFGASELLGANGAMAVFAFGITLGNLQGLKLSSFKLFKKFEDFSLASAEETFFSSLVFVVKTYFFVFMGLSINLTDWRFIFWGGVIAALLFVIRWFVVDIFLKGTMPPFDLKVTKIMAPKGLTEAALITFIGSEFLNNIAYPVIMFSILFTSILTFYIKSRYDGEAEEVFERQQRALEYPSRRSFHHLP